MPRTKPPSGYDPRNLTEAQVSQQVDDFMAANGWRRIRHSAGTAQRVKDGITVGHMAIGEPGIPDRQYIYYLDATGRTLTLWVELKRAKGGKVRASQEEWLLKESARGAVIYAGERGGRRFDIEHFIAWYGETLAQIARRV